MHTDASIIEAFQAGGEARDRAWKYIYNYWEKDIFAKAREAGATPKEAKIALNEICIQIERAVTRPGFVVEESLPAYFAESIYNRWIYHEKMKKRGIKQVPFEKLEFEHPGGLSSDHDLLEESRTRELDQILTKALDPKCYDILTMWINGYSHKEITEKLKQAPGTSNNQVPKCLTKLRAWLRANPRALSTLKFTEPHG